MRRISIIREPDDRLDKTRISLGEPKDNVGFYVVFRGEPEDVVSLLKEALKVAEVALPAGHYTDKREADLKGKPGE